MADISKIKVPINGTATTYNVKDATARTHISDTTVHVTAADKTNWNAKSELALGETSTTAYRGDRGKTAYTHATDSSRLTTDTDAGLYKVGCTAEGHIKELTAIVKSDITGLGIPGSDTNTIPSAYCNTAAGTAAKTASCTDYTLTSKTYLHVLIKTANSSAGKITLNVNGKGAKDIWINGAVSSASNYTLPAGSYITYYDGSKYLFRTDGKLVTSDLIAGLGTAAVKDVPSSGDASLTQVVMGNDSRLTNSRTPTSHTHGNIQNGGTLQSSDITIANGDKLIVTDASDSNKVARTSISFDGSTNTKALTQKGTWESFTNNNGTVTSVTLKATSPISIDSSAAITGSGTRTLSHATSGATAGSYGDSGNQTPNYGSTFKVPYITVNNTGHVTGISEHTVKIPASDNTDKNVTQTDDTTTTTELPILIANSTTTPQTSTTRKNQNFTFTPSQIALKILGLSQSWLNGGKFPQLLFKKPTVGTGAVTGLGMDTLAGRMTIATFPTSDEKLYFNYYTDTTLAGSTNKRDKSIIWDGSTGILYTEILDTKLQTSDISVANGDKLVVTDSSDSVKVRRSSITFDGSTTTQALSKKGTWESYLLSTGGTLTGNILLSVNTYETTPATDNPAQIQLQSVYTGGGSQYTSSAYIRAYSDHAGNGANLVLHSGGNLFIGSGEAPGSHYNLYKNNGSEITYITSDNVINIQAGAQTIGNRKGLKILSDGSVIPDVADVSTDNAGSIGTSSYKWSDIYTYKLNGKKVDNYTNFVRTGTIGNLSSTVDTNLRWYRVATWEITTKNTDVAAMISVSNTYTNGSTANQCAGLLYVHFRQSDLGTCQHANLNFVVNKGFTTNHFKLVWMPSDDPTTTGYDGLTCCLYTYIDVRYLTRRFTILDDGYRTATASLCNIFDNTSREVEPTTAQGWTNGVYAS